MTLRTSIKSTGKPTREEVRQEFRDKFPQCKGKKMVSYKVTIDSSSTNMDDYTMYHNVGANWYDVEASFS